ncbi:MAG: hypothetical protein HUJ61_00880 [Bacilli bacterium]|nr:hypothetical protein [Bacilli bacterium]
MKKKNILLFASLLAPLFNGCSLIDMLSSYSTKASVKNLFNNLGLKVLTPEHTQKILVIPVDFEDYPSTHENVPSLQTIYNGFFGETKDTGWESVSSYYYKSSYGALTLKGTVTDWFRCSKKASELQYVTSYKGSPISDPTWYVLREAVDWVKDNADSNGINLKDYDTDGDGYIDAVQLVYSCPPKYMASGDQNLFWAFTYWDTGTRGIYNNQKGCAYVWASSQFFNIGNYRDENGNLLPDSHTFIHETGHLLGLDDYYSYDNSYGPLGKCDMMDENVGDHNAYSKYLLGWTKPTYVNEAGTYVLRPFEETGDTLLFANSWNGTAFDEYILMSYYTPTGLNKKDSEVKYNTSAKMFDEKGVLIYHVNSKLMKYKFNYKSGTMSDRVEKGFVDNIYYKVEGDYVTFTDFAFSNSPKTNDRDENLHLISLYEAGGFMTFNLKDLDNEYLPATNLTLFKEGSTFPTLLGPYSTISYDDSSKFNFKVTFQENDNGTMTVLVANKN